MKKLYAFIVVLAIVLVAASTAKVAAQSTTDTVHIHGAQSLQISDIINADTSVTAYRVYVLDRGVIYYIDRAFEINSSCKFMAAGSAALRPPVLAPAIRSDGTSEEWYFKLNQTDIQVELNDLYLLSMRQDHATLGWSRAIWIHTDNTSLKLRRVIFDGWSEAGIRVEGADYFKLDVQDCHFRNMQHSSSYFGGQPFLTNEFDHPDTTIFINNTFFANNSYLFSVRGLGPKTVFEHNTVVYGAVNPLLIRQAPNLYLNNNLFYATHAWGGDPEQVIGGWFLNYPDTVSSSVFRIRKYFTNYHDYGAISGPERYYNDLGLIYDPHSWVNVAHNNDFYLPSSLTQFYTNWNDTVATYDSVEVILGPKQYLKRTLTLPRWINDLGVEVLDSVSNSSNWDYAPGVSVSNNFDLDPGFTDANVIAHMDSLIGYVRGIATRHLDRPWHFQLNFPPVWPLPENLVYTNSAMTHGGTDGFALGDLNWFPDQKALWIVSDVKMESPKIPDGFTLSEVYPNPFNPETNVKFSIPQTTNAKLVVYNLLGQEVKTLFNKEIQAGSYNASWNGQDNYGNQVSSGIYFLTLESQSFRATKKMILMK